MRFFLLLSLLIVFAPPAFAQQSASPSEQIDELLGQQKIIKQPTNLREYRDAFYAQCLKTKNTVVGGKNLERLCTCSSEKYSETFTLEQIREMEAGTKEGQFQHARLLSFVYVPCVQRPTYLTLMSTCMDNVQNKYLMKNQMNTCHCIADNISSQIGDLLPGLINYKVREGEKIEDPLSVMLHPNLFKARTYYFNDRCIQRHEPR